MCKATYCALFMCASLLALTCSNLNATAQKKDATPHPYASDKPLPEPTIFAKGTISLGEHESHPAFTPDGQTLYFLKNAPNFNFWTIVVSQWKNGRWTTPEVAEFSGQYSDADPFITADGSRLYFISNRPLDGKYTGKFKGDLDIWMVERTAKGWGPPQNLGEPVNSAGNEWYPTLASNGTIYFGSDRPGGRGATDLYRASLINGKYAQAENLGEVINTQAQEYEPFIAPDESFLIFMSARPGGLGGPDLYISYNRDGAWTKPVNLGDKINSSGAEYSPKISPDGKYFFWSSTRGFADKMQERRLTYQELVTNLRGLNNGLGNIYQIDLSALKIEK